MIKNSYFCIKVSVMKTFGIILNLLLAVASTWYEWHSLGEWDFEILIKPIVLFAALSFMHIRVCNTPTRATEKYESWRDLLPTASEIEVNKKISIGVIAFCYVILFILSLLISGEAWWHPILYIVLIVCPPLMVLQILAKGKTLENSKIYFGGIVTALKEPKYQHLNIDTEQITPDTKLAGGIAKRDSDFWSIVILCSDMIQKYRIPFFDESDKINKAWTEFTNRANKLKADSPAHEREIIIKEGILIGQDFCFRHKTVGGMAIWISDMIEAGKIKQFTDNAS